MAAAQDDSGLAAVVEELVDRYGPLPVEVGRLVSVAKLRLLAREYKIAEIGVTGTTLKVAPLQLPDSKQLRLKRLYPNATYRPATGIVQLPLPRVEDSVGAARVRDVQVLQFVADLLLALDGKAPGAVDVRIAPEAAAAR